MSGCGLLDSNQRPSVPCALEQPVIATQTLYQLSYASTVLIPCPFAKPQPTALLHEKAGENKREGVRE